MKLGIEFHNSNIVDMYFEIDKDCNAQMIMNYYFIPFPDLGEMHMEQHRTQFYPCSTEHIEYDQGPRRIILSSSESINLDGLVKGFFLDNVNIEHIENIMLKLNNIERTFFDKFSIVNMSQKISDNCYYLSIDNLPFDVYDWRGSITTSRIDLIELIVETNTPGSFDLRVFEYGEIHNNQCISTNHYFVRNIQYVLDNQYRNFNILFEPPLSTLPRRSIPTTTEPTLPINEPVVQQPESQIIPRSLDNNTICPITRIEIEVNEKYALCEHCKNHFSEDAIKDWLKVNNTCPICRKDFGEINAIYQNFKWSAFYEIKNVFNRLNYILNKIEIGGL